MNVIFGSGVIGLLAKQILGPSWTVVPFYRSRFFAYNPALDDNFVVADPKIDDVLKELTGTQILKTYPYKKAWSVAGHLTGKFDKGLCDDYLYKLHGSNVPSQANIYMSSKMEHRVYDLRLNQLYEGMVKHSLPELSAEADKGQVTSIGEHHFIRGGVRYDFDKAISTIPLDAMLGLMGIKHSLSSKPLHFLHVQTNDLDFEGFNQTLVVDAIFPFFKVSCVAVDRYLFYLHEEVPNPGTLLMGLIQNFEIIDGTMIQDGIISGQIPNLDDIYNKTGIHAVGSYAQWDPCMDVGSCIMRLLKYANNNSQSSDRQIIL